jgi:hypothetical protein
MNVYVLELERGKDAQYLSRRVVTRILSLTNMLGVSKIESGPDFIDHIKGSWQFLEEKSTGTECLGYLGGNPVYLKEEIAGFVKIGEKDLKIIFE